MLRFDAEGRGGKPLFLCSLRLLMLKFVFKCSAAGRTSEILGSWLKVLLPMSGPGCCFVPFAVLLWQFSPPPRPSRFRSLAVAQTFLSAGPGTFQSPAAKHAVEGQKEGKGKMI